MESNTFKAVPAIFIDICCALHWGIIELPAQRHLPVSEWYMFVFGVMHRQGVTRNIHIYFQSPPSRLQPCNDGAPSIDDRLRSLSNELALDTWSLMSSMRCQIYSQIFAAPSIMIPLILPHSAIYRYPMTISGFFGSCIVKALPEIFTFISIALYRGCINLAS